MSPYVLQLQVIQYSLELVPWIWINILLIHTDAWPIIKHLLLIIYLYATYVAYMLLTYVIHWIISYVTVYNFLQNI